MPGIGTLHRRPLVWIKPPVFRTLFKYSRVKSSDLCRKPDSVHLQNSRFKVRLNPHESCAIGQALIRTSTCIGVWFLILILNIWKASNLLHLRHTVSIESFLPNGWPVANFYLMKNQPKFCNIWFELQDVGILQILYSWAILHIERLQSSESLHTKMLSPLTCYLRYLVSTESFLLFGWRTFIW